jgi:thymidylate synthase
MSYADSVFIANCKEILTSGVWDTDQDVRPKWADGTPAHTVKKFGIVNRYNLAEEFPLLTLRRTYWKSAVDELLWIWQKKSNNIKDLHPHIRDAWAGEDGSIGKAYGYQLGIKHKYPEGLFDQVDRVIYDLKHNPASRRILTNIYNFADLHEMALYPSRIQHDLQRQRQHAECHFKPAQPGHAGGKQLERGAIQRPRLHDGADIRAHTR